MRHPFHRVHLWTLLIMVGSFAVFYNQRSNLTGFFVGKFVTELGWLPPDWIYSELVMGVMGSVAIISGWVFTKLHGWRSKSKPTEDLMEIKGIMQTLSQNIDTLNTNIYNQFVYFNPVLKEDGLHWELTEEGLIKLRAAKETVAQKRMLVEEKERELKQLQDMEIST